MRFLGALLLLPCLVLPCRVAAQAAMPAGGGVALPTVEHQGKWACGAQASEDTDIAVLADRARIRFLALQASLQSGQNQYLAESRRSLQESLHSPTIAYWAVDSGPEPLSGWPIQAPLPDSLAVSGFVANAEDTGAPWNGPTFFGPDPTYFLSGSFRGRSCFRMVHANIRPTLPWIYPVVPDGWVGLEFRPDPPSVKNSIRGVLWFDPHSAKLEVIEWRYVNLPNWAGGGDGRGWWAPGGGWVELSSLTLGGSFPLQWDVRTPVPTTVLNSGPVGRLATVTGGYLIRAGHIAEIRDSSGVAVARYRYHDW